MNSQEAFSHRRRALDKAANWSESCGPMIEDVSTLAELREHLAEAEGRAVVNGRPFVDGAGMDCHLCRGAITETAEVVSTEGRDGLLWRVTVSHASCEPEAG